MIDATRIKPRGSSTWNLCIAGAIMAVVGGLWTILFNDSRGGVAWPLLLGPPLFSVGVATCLVTLSSRTPELVAILLQLVAGAAVLGSAFLQWVGAGLSFRYDLNGQEFAPADLHGRLFSASLHWSQTLAVFMAVVGVIWCVSTCLRFLRRPF
jgi:hypothetical protein